MATEISPQEYLSQNPNKITSFSEVVFTLYRRFIGEFKGYPLSVLLSDSGGIYKQLVFGEFVKGLNSVEPEKERFAVYGSVNFYCDDRTEIFNPLNLPEEEFDELINRYQGYQLYVDDLRNPNTSDWVLARNSDEAITLMEHRGCPATISFDHDLGGDDTAMRIVKWMIEQDLEVQERFIPKDFEFNVHSANPVGRENLQGLLGGYLQIRKETAENRWLKIAVQGFIWAKKDTSYLFNAKLYTTEKTLLKLLELSDRRLTQLLKLAQSDLSIAEFKALLNQIHQGVMPIFSRSKSRVSHL